MESDAAEVAADYESTLKELVMNSKPQINMLTMVAEENRDLASTIVGVIEKHIEQVPIERMLPSVYLIDSIVKNCPKTRYRDLFARNIIPIFTMVFQKGDEKVRASLYKLRQTWNGIFPASRLYGIDIKVKAIDPAWPVTEPSTPAAAPKPPVSAAPPPPHHASIHVNPRFLTAKAPADAPPPADDAVSADAEQLRKLQRQKERLRKAAEQAGTPRQGQSAKARRPDAVIASSGDLSRDSTPASEDDLEARKKQALSSRSRKQRSNESAAAKQTSKKDRSTRKAATEASAASRVADRSSNMDVSVEGEEESHQRDVNGSQDIDYRKEKRLPPKKRTHSTDADSAAEADSDRLGGGEHLDKRQRRSPLAANVDEDLRQAALERETFPSRGRGRGRHFRRGFGGHHMARHAADWERLPAPRLVAPHVSQVHHPPAPTSTPGRHAFIDPAPVDLGLRVSSALLPTPALPPPISYAQATLPPVLAPPPIQPQPPPFPYAAPVEPPAPLEPIPANNRIFVDGKAYEVLYVDDTPVIERDGLPHRIYFTGPPRNVVIDGVGYSLAFGDTKTISIDGQQHVIRFGAPSRELYMGSYPFRGAFGGPPIFATVNGVRHEIRLSGPPPEVKIQPEPCYELLRYMPQNRQGQRPPVAFGGAPAPVGAHATAPTKAQVDVGSLLHRLKVAGVLNAAEAAGGGAAVRTPEANRSPARPATPPIPSQHHLSTDEVIERRPQPPANLKEFSMRSLKVRYQAAIDSLYQTKQRCPNCGLRFDDHEGQKYSRHLDWHFQENRRAQDSNRGMSRPWYLVVEDWISYTELTDDVSTAAAKSAVFESANSGEEAAAGFGGSVAVSAAGGQQNCAVCGEPFEQYFDEDDDEWKLRNAVVNEGKVFHPICHQDASVLANTSVDEPIDPAFLLADRQYAYEGLPGLEVQMEDAEVKPPAPPTAAVEVSAEASAVARGRLQPIAEAPPTVKQETAPAEVELAIASISRVSSSGSLSTAEAEPRSPLVTVDSALNVGAGERAVLSVCERMRRSPVLGRELVAGAPALRSVKEEPLDGALTPDRLPPSRSPGTPVCDERDD